MFRGHGPTTIIRSLSAVDAPVSRPVVQYITPPVEQATDDSTALGGTLHRGTDPIAATRRGRKRMTAAGISSSVPVDGRSALLWVTSERDPHAVGVDSS